MQKVGLLPAADRQPGFVLATAERVAAAFVNVSTGFCVRSFIYRLFMGKVAGN